MRSSADNAPLPSRNAAARALAARPAPPPSSSYEINAAPLCVAILWVNVKEPGLGLSRDLSGFHEQPDFAAWTIGQLEAHAAALVPGQMALETIRVLAQSHAYQSSDDQ